MTDHKSRPFRIALTGGPGGGKTTAADLFRRELKDKIVLVPEAATMLFTGGFPRSSNMDVVKYVQRAIFHVQKNLEEIRRHQHPNKILLCDRGTIDGAAYWPDGDGDYFEAMETTLEHELSRYDGVIFFETAAAGGSSIEGNNPARCENPQEALALDQKLRNLWSKHPNFFFVPNDQSFVKKIMLGMGQIQNVIAQLNFKNGNTP